MPCSVEKRIRFLSMLASCDQLNLIVGRRYSREWFGDYVMGADSWLQSMLLTALARFDPDEVHLKVYE